MTGGSDKSLHGKWYSHRRRIKTKEKAKVVASVWGEEFIKFLAAPAFLHWTIWIIGCQDDLKEKDEIILLFKIVIGKTASATKKLINSSHPQTEATTFAFFCLYPSSMGTDNCSLWAHPNTVKSDILWRVCTERTKITCCHFAICKYSSLVQCL